MDSYSQQIKPELNWQDIDTVLLDMDGTLLDKHFDDTFWQSYVIEKYAEKNCLSYKGAQTFCDEKFKEAFNGHDWTQTTYWSSTFGLDIIALQNELSHLIKALPSTIYFLNFLRSNDKKVIMVTDSDLPSLQLKLKQVNIREYFQHFFHSTSMGIAKTELDFWPSLHKKYNFDPIRTLFVDDRDNILQIASDFGIKHIVAMASPSSNSPTKFSKKHPSIASFTEIIF